MSLVKAIQEAFVLTETKINNFIINCKADDCEDLADELAVELPDAYVEISSKSVVKVQTKLNISDFKRLEFLKQFNELKISQK